MRVLISATLFLLLSLNILSAQQVGKTPGPVLIGNIAAPKTIDMYFSPSCPACASLFLSLHVDLGNYYKVSNKAALKKITTYALAEALTGQTGRFQDKVAESARELLDTHIHYEGKRIDDAFKEGLFNVKLHPIYVGENAVQKRALWADMLARCSSDYGNAMLLLISLQSQWKQADSDTDAALIFKDILTPNLLTVDELLDCLGDGKLAASLVRDHQEYINSVVEVPMVVAEGKNHVSNIKAINGIYDYVKSE